MRRIAAIFALSLSLSTFNLAYSAPNDTDLRKPRLSDTDILSRIEQIEKSMVALQKQVYSDVTGKSLGGDVTNSTLNASLEELHQTLKTIRGDIEQLQFENTKLNEKFVKFSSDVEFRLNELSQPKKTNADSATKLESIDDQLTSQETNEGTDQQALSTKKPQPAKPTAAINPASKPNDKMAAIKVTPDDSYQGAYDVLMKKDYNKAAQLFQEYIAKNPKHSLVGNAYYWLGEVATQKGDYNQAAIKYLQGFKANPKGAKAAENLLKLSESLGKLGKRKEACVSLIRLKKEFPNATNTIKKKLNEQITKLNCK